MYTTPNPFLQFVTPRLPAFLRRLQSTLWETPRPVHVSFAGAHKEFVSPAETLKRDFQPVTLPFHWGRMMYTGWFRLELPAATPGRTRWLRWDDQGEGTLHIDGFPAYGFDVAHKVFPLPESVTVAHIEGLCLQSAIWHPDAKGIDPQGSRLATAEVLDRNDAVWKALMDLDVLVNLLKDEATRQTGFGGIHEGGCGYRPKIEAVSPLLRRVLRLLDDAVMAYDHEGLPALSACLAEGYASLRGAESLVKGLLTGHAHIDLVWLWDEFSGEYKARHTFASMNALMDQYPDFHFAYSQSASYEAVGRCAPALLERVKERVREGRWEPVGATYVESDTLVACGEALARSFLVGQEVFRDLFGDSSRLLWLPDVFGYSGCLPQIMRQCGVDRFFTTKLTWSNINLFPHSSFRWRGNDGSEVLTHVTQGLGYNQNATPAEVRMAAREHRQSDVHGECLLPTGFGDGGGGVTPEMCERALRLRDLAGVPSTRWGRLEDFYDRLEAVRENLPIYQGELYLEFHRGTFTTHSDLKRDFRALERALMLQEAAHALHRAGPIDLHAWKRLVFAQFHDYIPGSSIWEVYENGLPELRDLAAQAHSALGKTLGSGPCLANLLPMPRAHAVNGRLVELTPLSACDPASLPGETVATPVADAKGLHSARVSATFNARGEVESLVIDGKPVAQANALNRLVTYADHPHCFDAWDIDRQTLHHGVVIDSPAERVGWTAPDGCAGIAFRRRIGKTSQVEIRYSVDAVLPVLRVELDLDWQEDHVLLKAQFPTTYNGRFARFGSPYNSVLRGQLPGDPKDEAMFESCASRWAVVMNDAQTEGLSLITEAKYGFACREGTLGLSLIRSVSVCGQDREASKFLTHEIRDGGARPLLSDQGRHTLRYAVAPFHACSDRSDNPAALADLLYTPVLPAAIAASSGLLGIDGGDSLIPAWAKPLAGGAWMLRLHETLGADGEATLRLAPGWTARRSTLAETDEGPVGNNVPFRAYEIVSLKMQPPV